MNIKRFFGKNSREALSYVRKELGEDAVILSNRAMNGGNEIMAFKEQDMKNMVAREDNQRHAISQNQQQTNDSNDPPTLLSLLQKKNLAQAAVADAEKVSASNTELVENKTIAKPAAASVLLLNKETSQQNPQMTEMLNEIRNMRSVIESQLTTISWGNIQQRDPIKSQILNTLLSAGFSASLSRQLVEKMPENLGTDKATTWIKSILAKNLDTIQSEAEILDKGGIFALIGPTGVGKTTTTAKLAARYVMKHGT
ncbi:MAG: flagellar biosynthesis protein FlhF, partial [Betaproteobacteria bacterium]